MRFTIVLNRTGKIRKSEDSPNDQLANTDIICLPNNGF